ncbi:ABC transporter related protein [Caldisalinibacter kiritimatiensis]|uniref:ABC transporter related protein n=2 Tax=Caldisalinibacter kiritimatiensis TaxID=1304284 RepID=R1CCP5_9FIRM|nr:ATP-binding cassette domain-containing protein [Caldisalinibacter kiritimatiensis]EOD00055.1 ABC transporter related protein [Caldisalinibacter kiritimatiensis]
MNAIGIKPILKKKPLDCSGGERSRAVFARGIIMKPQIILDDEPTASLDVKNKEGIVNLLFKMNKEFDTTIITVTHDLEVAKRHDRIISLEMSK